MPDYNLYHIPPRVTRRDFTSRVRRRRSCNDEKPYFPVIWTIPEEVIGVDDFGPVWVADRDFWIAGASASMDSNAGGSDLRMNFRRGTLTSSSPILASDSRLVIETGEDTDSATNDNDAPLDAPDFAIDRLLRGETAFCRITQFGTGDRLQMTLKLVPIRAYVGLP